MKIKISLKRLLVLMLGIVGISTPNALVASETEKPQTIERYYFVKGMTCGGCVFGVKKALERVGIKKEQILEVDYRSPDPKNHVGHAKVRFSKNEYKGQETDCKIVGEIKNNPGYTVYWDQQETNPCKLK